MCKLRHIFKNLLPGIIMLLSAGLFAQEDKLSRAQQLHRAKNTEQAVLAIDSVVLHPETRNDFMSWTTRAYIYFDLYKKTDKQKLNSSLRDTIVSSLIISNKLNPDSGYRTNNKRLLTSVAGSCFNIAKSLLEDSLNYERSFIAYKRYKEIMRNAEPGMNFSAKDIEYYRAVGSVYSDIFIKDNNNSKAADIAKVTLLKVLEVQPDDPKANINMGLMYYNQAANLGKSLDYGADFTQIDIVQENMVKLAKQSEQFIVKVYNNDHKNAKAVEALHYIYRMLSEYTRSDEFKKKGEELGINFDQITDKPENKNNQQSKDK